jgi:hypothetical protein
MKEVIESLMRFFGLSSKPQSSAKHRDFDLSGETKGEPELGRQLLARWSGHDGRDARERQGDDALRDLFSRRS